MKIVFLLLVLMTVPSVLHAQELPDRQGTKAVFFGVEGSRIGFDLGGKYWVSNTVALNGKLFYDTSKSNGNVDVVFPGLSTSGGDTHSQFYEFGLSMGINRYWTAGKWSPYLGGQIGVSKSHDKNVFDAQNNSAGLISYNDETNVNNYDLDAVVGAEFWISQSLSLAAEYAYGVTYGVSRVKNKLVTMGSPETTDSKSSGYSIGGGGSTILLNIYF
jgi:preprotein translocase subunit Sec61beta